VRVVLAVVVVDVSRPDARGPSSYMPSPHLREVGVAGIEAEIEVEMRDGEEIEEAFGA